MRAMILAAGRGTRLRPLTDHTPKPLLPVGDKPLIERQIEWLARAGIEDVVINLFHLGHQIEERLRDGADFGVRIHYSREAELLETGGGIVNALPLLGAEPFLVLNGDIYLECDLGELIAPLAAERTARLLLTPTPAFREHGDFDLDEHGTVCARGEGYVFCGIALYNPRLFEGLVAQPFSVRELWFRELSAGTLEGAIYRGYWTDIGTQEQLQSVQARFSTP